jgi:dolichyl-phosphate beta-glucosyltransferase
VRTQIVIPCFNEEHRLPVADFIAFCRENADIGFLFVNDGSTDATPELLAHLQRAIPAACDILSLPRNFGKAEAVRQGLLRALASRPDFAGYWDADCATPLDEIPRFLSELEGNAALMLIMGARVKMLGTVIDRRVSRHYCGRVFATCALLATGLPAFDTQCGAKLLRAVPWLAAILQEPITARWLVDIELLLRLDAALAARGAPALASVVRELPLTRWRDVGKSYVKPTDFFIALVQLLKFRLKYGKCRDVRETPRAFNKKL